MSLIWRCFGNRIHKNDLEVNVNKKVYQDFFNMASRVQSSDDPIKAASLYIQLLSIIPSKGGSEKHSEDDIHLVALESQIFNNLGLINNDAGELNRALSFYQEALNLMGFVRTWFEDNNKHYPVIYQNDLASAYINLANFSFGRWPLSGVTNLYLKAVNLMEDIRKRCDDKNWPLNYQQSLANAYGSLAQALDEGDTIDDTNLRYQQAISLMENIRRCCKNSDDLDWPEAYQDNLANVYTNFAISLKNCGEVDVAKRKFKQAIFLREDNYHTYDRKHCPIKYQEALAISYAGFADLLGSTAGLDEAKGKYQQALQLYDDIFCKKNIALNKVSLDIKQHRLLIWRNYLSVADSFVTKRFIEFTSDAITLLDSYTDKKNELICQLLLHRMVAFSLKHNEINLAIKLIHCVQGRELAYALETSQLTGDESAIVNVFVEQREQYRTLLVELSDNSHNDIDFLNKLGSAKDTYSQSRASVAALPEYAPLLSPLNIEITDIQATQGQGQATLMWLSFTDDKEFPVNGVLAIPVSGEPQYFDLTDSLERLLTLHDDLAKLMSGRGYRKNVMDYSEAEIQAVVERYTDDGDVKTPEFVIKQVWHNITRTMKEIWQDNNSELGHWLTHHGIGEVLNLTQGKTHNFPLALGCAETIKHRFIPGLALWRQRQALNLGQENTSNHHRTISSQTCIGKAIASEHEDTSLLIPHTVLEQQALLTQFSDTSHNSSNAPSNTSQAINLTTQDAQTAKTLFPHHDKPLGFVHIACHGVPDKDKAGGAKLMLGENSIVSDALERMKNTVDVAFFNACIAGTTQDDTKGEHHGLLIPLLTKAHQVIAATLPLDDVKASYFAVLLFHYYWREAKPLTESVTLAKADLQTGLWPTQVKDSVISIYHQAVDELPEDYLEHIIRSLYPPVIKGDLPITELCYCLQIFNLNSLNIDHSYPEIQANMKALISQQFEKNLTAHLQDTYEGEMAQELLTVFVNSIKVFG
jgi:tetratricopeptide (TPR) repeat protein